MDLFQMIRCFSYIFCAFFVANMPTLEASNRFTPYLLGAAKRSFPACGAACVKTDWLPINPPTPAPRDLNSLPHVKINNGWKEEKRFPYHNERGELLGYNVKLMNEKGKIIWPMLSYGFYDESKLLEPHWRFRSFVKPNEECPLYDLHTLVANPYLPVVILEGEEACEAAKENLYDCVPTTCKGGKNGIWNAGWDKVLGRWGVFVPTPPRGNLDFTHIQESVHNSLLRYPLPRDRDSLLRGICAVRNIKR